MKKEISKVNKFSEDLLTDKIIGLKRIIPEVFSEDKIDWEKLKMTLGGEIDNRMEKYGLSWAGKSEAFRAIRIPATGTLVPQEKESKDIDKTQNIFIEGDNLEALKLLQKHYREQIKMIYIDPPYNTGKDFIYKDNFTEGLSDYYERTGQSKDGVKMTSNPESNGRYHSDWLTMMYSRLFMARNLLREDGVMFISIDDNEVHNLRMIMDEIFGEENFVAQITVVGNPRGRDYGGVAKMHDYALVYTKSEISEINDLNEPDKIFPYEDEKSGFEIRELRNRNIAFHVGNRPNLYYPFYVNPKNKDKNGFFEISLEKHKDWIEVYPKVSQGFKTVWRWGKPRALEYLNKEIVGKEMEDGGFQITEKYREKTRMARSVWWDKEDNTEKGTLLVKSLFNKKVFDFPKPIEMIRKIVEMGTEIDKNSIVLDFFAGSGTTAHAVMDLNAEDGGNRKWICVQIPEETDEKSEAKKAGFNTITEIARERICRAGDSIKITGAAKVATEKSLLKYTKDEGKSTDDKVESIKKLDDGFKAFKLSESNYRQWNVITDKDDEKKLKAQMKLFVEKPLVDNYDEKSVAYEVLVKEGFDLNAKVEQVKIGKLEVWTIVDSERKAVITFAKKLTKDQVDSLGLSENDTFICLDSALDDTTKVNLMRNYNIKVI